MKTIETNATTFVEEPRRKLSILRLIMAIFILAGLVWAAIWGWQVVLDREVFASYKPWFASYVDVTAQPTYAFEQLGTTSNKNVILSFIVASSSDPCTPTWGDAYTLDQARGGVDLDRRIARLRQQGGSIAISFGGQRNNELALVCKDTQKLGMAYQSVIDRYGIDTIDLDLEGNGLTDLAAAKRRSQALKMLQKARRSEGKSLAIWLTVPVAPQGLTEDGTNAISTLLTNGVDLSGVNVLTMDYGQSRDAHVGMEQASERALIETHRQLGILYKKAGINLSNATIWTKIGATPMIGQNDIPEDVFSVDDAKLLNKFVKSQGVARVSMWSANRDVQCGGNYINTTIVSDSCSGVKQDPLQFGAVLGDSLDATIKQNSSRITVNEKNINANEQDDPAHSPYQIWQKNGAYLEGTKVVWHKNVYQAKWWTQGDMPDNPVLQSWQTSWQLIGPVLPGEKPIPQPTLPAGTYPDWDGKETYDAGQRVLLNGVPYQAKWWTQGDSPSASVSNPDGSPWVALTQKQIEDIVHPTPTGQESSK